MAVLSLIAAMAPVSDGSGRHVIGAGGNLPWHFSEDLRHFRRTTLGKPMLMGRATYDSLPAPLPGRTHLVLSRTETASERPDVRFYTDLEEAVAQGLELAERQQADELVVIGGAEIYRQLLGRVQRLYITRIGREYAGDTFFPEVDWSQWHQQDHAECMAADTALRFLTYAARHTGGRPSVRVRRSP